jgi:hypothetical protein
MGTLVVMHYRTKLFADLADHTYVKCANDGVAWTCWGGNTRGSELRRADGSTARAGAIAGTDGKANIKCYLINGVCHQAANRILLPAGITVEGARGYHVSDALFGPYGRPSGPLGTCQSPFDQQAGVTGELSACEAATAPPTPAMPVLGEMLAAPSPAPGRRHRPEARPKGEAEYIDRALALYQKAGWPVAGPAAAASDTSRLELTRQPAATPPATERDVEGLEAALFDLKVDRQLAARAGNRRRSHLEHLRRSTGRSIMLLHQWFTNGQMPLADYLDAFDHETFLFQQAIANALNEADYRALLGLPRGEFVLLADRTIAPQALEGLRS